MAPSWVQWRCGGLRRKGGGGGNPKHLTAIRMGGLVRTVSLSHSRSRSFSNISLSRRAVVCRSLCLHMEA